MSPTTERRRPLSPSANSTPSSSIATQRPISPTERRPLSPTLGAKWPISGLSGVPIRTSSPALLGGGSVAISCAGEKSGECDCQNNASICEDDFEFRGALSSYDLPPANLLRSASPRQLQKQHGIARSPSSPIKSPVLEKYPVARSGSPALVSILKPDTSTSSERAIKKGSSYNTLPEIPLHSNSPTLASLVAIPKPSSPKFFLAEASPETSSAQQSPAPQPSSSNETAGPKAKIFFPSSTLPAAQRPSSEFVNAKTTATANLARTFCATESEDIVTTLGTVLTLKCNESDPVISGNGFVDTPLPWMVYEFLQLMPNNIVLATLTNNPILKQQLFTVMECPHTAGLRAVAEFCCILASIMPHRTATRFLLENEPLLCNCIIKNCESYRVFAAVYSLLTNTRYFVDSHNFAFVVLKAVLHLAVQLNNPKRYPEQCHSRNDIRCQAGPKNLQQSLTPTTPSNGASSPLSPPTGSPRTPPSLPLASLPPSQPAPPPPPPPSPLQQLSHIIALLHSCILCFMPSETLGGTPLAVEQNRPSEMLSSVLNLIFENKVVFSILCSKCLNCELASLFLSLVCDVFVLTPPQHTLFNSIFNLIIGELKTLYHCKQLQTSSSEVTMALACLTLAITKKVDTLYHEAALKNCGDLLDIFFHCKLDTTSQPIALQIVKCVLSRLPELQTNLSKHKPSSRILETLYGH
ncbi:hypothetical protein Pelo_12862 [Pelomyxa schiedti]|nr:hypothetical protein Pelo_12862 [Pelomyxa schiedti]